MITNFRRRNPAEAWVTRKPRAPRGSVKKITIADIDQTLKNALAEPRTQYHQFYKERLRQQVDALAAKLAENGMDLEIVAPYPKSNIGRNAYIAAVELRNFATKYFKSTATYGRGMHDPNIVARVDDAKLEEILEASAKKATEMHFDGYIIKLAGKIGKTIAEAELVGGLWNDSVLTIKAVDGEVQVWHTHCIWNVSCLGRIFNQWPTRRQS
jgi:hypothetical protein